jgi:hypothetical protein
MNRTRTGLLLLNNFDKFIFAFIAFVLVILFTRHNGVGVSPDSIVYLSVARNLATHGLPMDYTLEPVVDFPVFYPWFLSAADLITGIDPLALGPYLNGILFAGTVITSGYLLGPAEKNNTIYRQIILFSIALSPSLLEIYSMLWSETLFIFLSLVFIAAFRNYFTGRKLLQLSFCAVIAGLACVTRYAGITVVATGLMLLVFDPGLPLKKKAIHTALFAVFSTALLLANLWHNFRVEGLATGPREPGITPLSENIRYYANVICEWLPIPVQDHLWCTIIVLILLLSTTGMFLQRVYNNQNYTAAGNIFTAFFIVYTVFIIGISTLSHFEQMNNRLLSPLFIPLLIALTFRIPGCLKNLQKTTRQLTLIAVFLFVIAFQVNQLARLNESYTGAVNYGVPGYTDDSWKNSPVAKFIRVHHEVFDPRYSIYSNAQEAVYFTGNLRSFSLPHHIDKKDVRDFFMEKSMYLIWFDQIADPELIDLDRIRKNAQLIKKYVFKDGVIYFVLPLKQVNL